MIDVVVVSCDLTNSLYFLSPNDLDLKLNDEVLFEDSDDFLIGKIVKLNYKEKVSDIYIDMNDIFQKHDKLKSMSLDEIEHDKYFDKSIWDEYAKKDDRFTILSQENCGHAVATNNGMKLAKGEEEQLEEEAEVVDEEMVWLSRTGKCYHCKRTCSNMKDPIQVPLSEVLRKNKTACTKCYN